MTRKEVYEMIFSLSQRITYQDKYHIEIESVYEGESITFRFNDKDILISIG